MQDLGLLAPSKKEFSKPVALTEMSFLTRSDLSDEKKNMIKENSLI